MSAVVFTYIVITSIHSQMFAGVNSPLTSSDEEVIELRGELNVSCEF
jgi:hypothetical protein